MLRLYWTTAPSDYDYSYTRDTGVHSSETVKLKLAGYTEPSIGVLLWSLTTSALRSIRFRVIRQDFTLLWML